MQKPLEHLIENLSLDIKNYTHKLKSTSNNQLSLETKRWGDLDFVEHFFLGRGRTVYLSQIGHLYDIRDEAYYTWDVLENFTQQIAEEAAKVKSGSLYEYFHNSYNFRAVEFSHGGAVLRGEFRGYVEPVNQDEEKELYRFYGEIDFNFSDEFTEPLKYNLSKNFIKEHPKLSHILDPFGRGYAGSQTNLVGIPFDVLGEWQESIDEKCDEYGRII